VHVDLTVAAIPFFFASMGAEAWWLRRTAAGREPTAGDYERRDTVTSLTMGTASLLMPLAYKPLARRLDLGSSRTGRLVAGAAAAAALAAVAADAVVGARALEAGRVPDPEAGDDTAAEAPAGAARKVAGSAAVAAIAGTGMVAAGTWANRTTATRLFRRRVLPDWGTGPGAVAAAVLGWDFIYYWNHRFMHEARYMWAIHVVHHSSERYNLSTALRQPVADGFGTFVPYGLLALLGLRPDVIETARAVNLIYQYWIHTEVIGRLGPFEEVLNTPSHHRAHHGSNRQYLDRNHGSILILWDRLFGTFEREDEPVVYGLTRNIETFNPLRVATHEYVDMAGDVYRSGSWHDRLSYVLRGPGWAYRRRAEAAPADAGALAVAAEVA
jgi:sterol desaturase/sphingolipid hydroxylase (fatty acid hydroxylase superfamily)